jgi:hypothetical protein
MALSFDNLYKSRGLMLFIQKSHTSLPNIRLLPGEKIWKKQTKITGSFASKMKLYKRRAGGVAQVVERLPSKRETLSLNHQKTKQNYIKGKLI